MIKSYKYAQVFSFQGPDNQRENQYWSEQCRIKWNLSQAHRLWVDLKNLMITMSGPDDKKRFLTSSLSGLLGRSLGFGVFPASFVGVFHLDSFISVLYSTRIQPQASVNKETTLIFHNFKTLENVWWWKMNNSLAKHKTQHWALVPWLYFHRDP